MTSVLTELNAKCSMVRQCNQFLNTARKVGPLYEIPGPDMKGTDRKADFHYYNWVDIFNTLGLGQDVPIATGSGFRLSNCLDTRNCGICSDACAASSWILLTRSRRTY